MCNLGTEWKVEVKFSKGLILPEWNSGGVFEFSPHLNNQRYVRKLHNFFLRCHKFYIEPSQWLKIVFTTINSFRKVKINKFQIVKYQKIENIKWQKTNTGLVNECK